MGSKFERKINVQKKILNKNNFFIKKNDGIILIFLLIFLFLFLSYILNKFTRGNLLLNIALAFFYILGANLLFEINNNNNIFFLSFYLLYYFVLNSLKKSISVKILEKIYENNFVDNFNMVFETSLKERLLILEKTKLIYSKKSGYKLTFFGIIAKRIFKIINKIIN